MGVVDLFSKRQKRLRGDVPDVYTYDTIPDALRVQICHIWRGTLGSAEEYFASSNVRIAYATIVETLCREYGWFALTSKPAYSERNHFEELVEFFVSTEDIAQVLDAVEVSFWAIDEFTQDYHYLGRTPSQAEASAEAAKAELNTRFREHGVGYQYEGGKIVRVDSQVVHREAVKPALQLLSGKGYKGAQQEFLRAHEHYRAGNTKEALNEALKAFESTLKAICTKRGWAYPETATSKALLEVCFLE